MNAPVFPLKLSAKDRKRLEAASKARRDTPERLAAKAVRQFLDHEQEYDAAVKRARDDVRAGRTYSSEEVFAEAYAIIDAARERLKRKKAAKRASR